ncbi:MAG: TIGR00266 family protein [Phycisphaerae bacterium]|nr:TIGR00266 family protein [Phycisphaerae bacterium]
MAEWYYLKNNQQHGPVAGPELKKMADAGGLVPTDLVWREGMEQWAPAGRVGGLFSGVEVGAPPPLPAGGQVGVGPRAMRCHEITYEIFGDDMQVVEVELDPGETVIAEAGGMNYMEEDITFEAKMGDGSQPDATFFGKLLQGAKRVVTGESLFMTHFTNAGGRVPRRVAFAAPYPGKIVALNLAEVGGELTCQKDSFLCAALGTEVGIAFAKRLGTGLFGGEGFILQRLRGDGMAFLHAGGTIIRRQLNGQTLRVDTGCLVAFTPGIDYDIQRSGGLKSMVFGGEGLFLATLRGHGTVWLQTLPFSRLADRIISSSPRAGGSGKEQGSVLGGLGNLFGD